MGFGARVWVPAQAVHNWIWSLVPGSMFATPSSEIYAHSLDTLGTEAKPAGPLEQKYKLSTAMSSSAQVLQFLLYERSPVGHSNGFSKPNGTHISGSALRFYGLHGPIHVLRNTATKILRPQGLRYEKCLLFPVFLLVLPGPQK